MEKQVSINDFPNELLIMIFARLYKLHRRDAILFRAFDSELSDAEESDEDILSPHPEKRWLGDPFDPYMFPHAHAKVCRRWCALLADRPAYWTRIPITIGLAATPFPTAVNYFCWSRDLPIQVFVKRHYDDLSTEDLEEKFCVAALVPYISQNLHRIKDLELALLHRASIPDLRLCLVGKADILESLLITHKENWLTKSTARLDEEDDTDNRDDGDRVELKFSARELTSLSIDVQNFARACSSNERWLAETPKLSRLSLISFGPSSPTQHLSIKATIRAIAHARELRAIFVRGIHFLDDYAPPETPQVLPEISSTWMTFEDLPGTAISTFVRAAGAIDGLSVNNCSLLGLESFFAAALRLHDLDEDCDLTIPFSDVRTHDVRFTDCPSFNDAFLDFMADGGPNRDTFPAMAMWSLVLTNCTNFRVENLYRMILARRNAVESNPAWDGTPVENIPLDPEALSAIVSLYVRDGPFLSGEYRTKFEMLVPSFFWIHAEEGDAVEDSI